MITNDILIFKLLWGYVTDNQVIAGFVYQHVGAPLNC